MYPLNTFALDDPLLTAEACLAATASQEMPFPFGLQIILYFFFSIIFSVFCAFCTTTKSLKFSFSYILPFPFPSQS